MKELKKQIATEAIKAVAIHYNTTPAKVAEAIAFGNTKIIKAVNDICEKTLESLYE